MINYDAFIGYCTVINGDLILVTLRLVVYYLSVRSKSEKKGELKG